MWQLVLCLSFDAVVSCHFVPWDHLMHVRRCLLDVRCAIVRLNVFFVLLCRDNQQQNLG